MNKVDTESEFSSLLSDIKEQIRYLQELGVGHIQADMPTADIRTKANIEVDTDSIPHEKLEKLVQPAAPAQQITPVAIHDEKIKIRRRDGIFDSTKLSRLSSVKGRDSKQSPIEKTPLQIKKEYMAKETQENDLLLDDISSALPESGETLEQIRDEIGGDCTRCRLCEKRTQVVNSVGNPNANLMFVGEAPGADEDEQGEPFVGRAGKLLTKMIEGIDLRREDVFIGNINRCRPPGNRQPQADEAEICRPFLLREISVVRPKVIIVMGNTACQNLLSTRIGITKLRGEFKDYFGVKVMPTFHPAYLLRDPRKKREVWEDLKTVRDYLLEN